MFVYWQLEDAGSVQTLINYSRAARGMGHEVVLYGDPVPGSRFKCSRNVPSADAVIFLLEWNVYLHRGQYLDLNSPLMSSARDRRVVIDNDGMYNDVLKVDGDYTHPHAAASRRRQELYDRIADKIYQPTLHPLRPNVASFLFHGYSSSLEVPYQFDHKPFGMFYIGSNWFRWRAMRRVLDAVEPIRDAVGRIGVAGHNWDGPPPWVRPPLTEAYRSEPEYLRRLRVEVMPSLPIDQVIPAMSSGVFNPVLVRPTFNLLRLVNPRLFETLAAGTIPLFQLDPDYVEEIYGRDARELVLDADPSELIRDVVGRPEHYAEIATSVRDHVRERHSYERRLKELIDIVRS